MGKQRDDAENHPDGVAAARTAVLLAGRPLGSTTDSAWLRASSTLFVGNNPQQLEQVGLRARWEAPGRSC